ncbi:hypothetical protein ACEPAG_2136 [Sanghuangporus baumii]
MSAVGLILLQPGAASLEWHARQHLQKLGPRLAQTIAKVSAVARIFMLLQPITFHQSSHLEPLHPWRINSFSVSSSLFPDLPAMSNREGDKYRALENYVTTNFPESHVSWSQGDPTIRGSEYQAHVVHYGSRIVKNSKGLWMQTLNGSTVEQAADNLLKFLQQREATGMKELKDYVKEEGYEEKGFIVEVEGPARSDRLYKASVHLSIDFCRKTHRNRFVLGVAIRKSTGIAAREVLEILKFKKKNGFMWVDDTLIKEASVKYACEAESDALLKKQADLRKRGKDLSPYEFSKINENKLVPQVTWLGRKFKGPPDFYTGQLPELSKELHKVLKANGYVLDPVEEKKATIKAEKKAEAKENSKISNLSKRLGLK